jgi:hypothetical protein
VDVVDDVEGDVEGAGALDETAGNSGAVESTARAAPMMVPSEVHAPTRAVTAHNRAINRMDM